MAAQYLLSIDSPETQRQVLEWLRQFPDVYVVERRVTSLPDAYPKPPETYAELLADIEEADHSVAGGSGIPLDELKRQVTTWK